MYIHVVGVSMYISMMFDLLYVCLAHAEPDGGGEGGVVPAALSVEDTPPRPGESQTPGRAGQEERETQTRTGDSLLLPFSLSALFLHTPSFCTLNRHILYTHLRIHTHSLSLSVAENTLSLSLSVAENTHTHTLSLSVAENAAADQRVAALPPQHCHEENPRQTLQERPGGHLR